MTKTDEHIRLRTKGILPVQRLKHLVDLGMVQTDEYHPINEDQYQPNSIDLRLGEKAYRVRCSFLPEDETVLSKVDKLMQYEFSIEEGAVLEPNAVYIIPLLESLDLSRIHKSGSGGFGSGKNGILETTDDVSAKTNPKSTTGRLDIFTRVITDYSHRFEEVRAGYKGRLYLEVVPKSFPIRVKTGQRLNQLRVRHGQTVLSDEEILRTHGSSPLLFDEHGEAEDISEITVNNGLFMRVNLLAGAGDIVGYKAKKHRELIDLEKINHYRITDFWDPIYARRDDYIILEPEAFYIFASKERCRIPSHLAAEMIAYDTGSGELRTHYAGFFDSGFGVQEKDQGAHAVLEVRSHDVPFLIQHGQTFCSMRFEPNTDLPEFVYGNEIKSNYQGQGLKLGKHFKDETHSQ